MRSTGRTVSLGDVIKLQRGFDLPSDRRTPGKIPVVSSGGITGFHSEAKVRGPGVITARYGSVGEVYFLEEDYWPLNTTLWVSEFKGNHPRFVYFMLQCMNVTKYSDKTGVPGVNRNDLHKIAVFCPPITFQIKIANTLDTWEKAITQLSGFLAAKTCLKQAFMQQLLTGKWRLPGFQHSVWKRHELGEFFERKCVRLGNQAEPIILSCTKNQGIVSQAERFAKRLASENLSNYKVVEREDLVYDPMLLWDGSIGFVEKYDRGVVSPAYETFRFIPKRGFREYFTFLFDGHYMRHQYKVISQGTNTRRRKAPAEAFLATSVMLPGSLGEQRAIAAVLATADRELALLRRQLDLLKKQKRGLMQKLLTGQIRVKV